MSKIKRDSKRESTTVAPISAPIPASKRAVVVARWETLRNLVLEYRSLGSTNPDRARLREEIARKLAGAVWAYTDEGVKEVVKDPLSQLVREEFRRHKRQHGGGLQAAFGGTDLAAPELAAGLWEDRFAKANKKAGPRVTFLSAMVDGWDQKESLEAHVRILVRHFLADTMEALEREADPKRTPRNPERRKRLLNGARLPVETDWPEVVGDDGIARPVDFEALPESTPSRDAALDAALAALRKTVGDELDRAAFDWLLEPKGVTQKELAARFEVAEGTVKNRLEKLKGRLRAMIPDGAP